MITTTPRLVSAINKAAYAHRNQIRKGTDLPYIVHPFSVMCIAGEATDDEDILIACLMHDVLEDVPDEISRDEMAVEFGSRVLKIVEGVTKDESIADWKKRNDAYLLHLENIAPIESVIVSCADKIHNLMSMLQDYQSVGEDLWSRFGAGKEQQQWWYEAVLGVAMRCMPHLTLNKKLESLINDFKNL